MKTATETVLSYVVVPLHTGRALTLMDEIRYRAVPSEGLMQEDSNEHAHALVHGTASVVRIAVILCNCLLFIGVGASVIVHLCHALVHYIAVDSATIGATLLAFGSEVRI